MKRKRFVFSRFLLLIIFSVILLCNGCILRTIYFPQSYKFTAEELFTSYLSPEIPKSVSELDGYFLFKGLELDVRLFFKISEEDFYKLVEEGGYISSGEGYEYDIFTFYYWDKDMLETIRSYYSHSLQPDMPRSIWKKQLTYYKDTKSAFFLYYQF